MSVLDRTALRALAGIVVSFALGGCAGTNVGNTWQCPLVQGSACARVAEADPASPQRISIDMSGDDGTATARSALPARRYRNGTGARVPASRRAETAREPEPTCRENCRPQDRSGWRAGSTDEGPEARRETQAETGSAGGDAEPAASWRDSARTPEVLGRIWIAPYVDASNVYHEASWVRIVIEPAGWRNEP